MKRKTSLVTLCNILCAVLMLALVICQFLPFWGTGAEQTSIQGYTWFPEDHTDLTSSFKSQMGSSFVLNDVVLMPILVLIAGACGAVMCLWKSKESWVALLPAICGISGIVGYLTVPVFQTGSLWVLHLVLSIAMTVVSVIPLVRLVREVISWFVPQKA